MGNTVDYGHQALCNGCNLALGMLREDVARILRLADYVLHHQQEAAGV